MPRSLAASWLQVCQLRILQRDGSGQSCSPHQACLRPACLGLPGSVLFLRWVHQQRRLTGRELAAASALGAAIAAACRATRWLTTGGWCGVTESSSEQVLREDTARGKGQVSVGACRGPYSLEARRELGKSKALTR